MYIYIIYQYTAISSLIAVKNEAENVINSSGAISLFVDVFVSSRLDDVAMLSRSVQVLV